MKHLTFILLSLAAASCGPTRTADLPVIDIAGNVGTYHQIPASEYIGEIEYIPLETHPEALIGQHRHMIATPTRIFVAGNDFCYAFDRDGRFVNKIGQAGRGPGEYRTITNLSVDEARELIWIDTAREVFEYRWDGQLMRTITLPLLDKTTSNRSSAYNLGDGTFIGHTPDFSGRGEHSWSIMDEDGNVLKTFPRHITVESEPDRDPVTRRMGMVNDLDGGLSFWPEWSSDGEMAQMLSAFDMKNLLTEEYFATHPPKDPAAHARLRALLQNLDETDNPVIAIAKTK